MRARFVVAVALLASSFAVAQFSPFSSGGNTASGGGSGVTALGPVGGTPNANGGAISGSTYTQAPADGTNPGAVSIGAQDFKGKKRLLDGATLSLLDSGSSISIVSGGASSGTALGVVIDNSPVLNTLGDTRISFRSGGVEYASVDFAGVWTQNAIKYSKKSLFNCSSGSEGTVINVTGTGAATGVATKFCLCRSDGASVYRWLNLTSNNIGTTTSDCPT